jgi:DNA-damage-inducible protein D
MAKELIQQSVFEKLKQTDETGNEFWSARELAKILDYTDYRNFKSVIDKAKEACQNSGYATSDYFVEFNEMIGIGKGAKRQIDNIRLSRYACYLIVQNADPAKEVVAIGQTYFAVQTRLQEISKMQEYTRLTDENEKRLFLRNEQSKQKRLPKP